LLFFICIKNDAQVLRRPVAAGYLGFGAYSLNHTDIFSFTANQAALAQLKNNAVGIYGERRFLLNELSSYTAVAGIKTSSGNFGLKTNYSGFKDYNETLVGLAYARSLGNKIDVGAQFNFHNIRITEYGTTSAIGFEVSALLHLTEKLHTGIQISNPVGGKFGKNNEEKLSSLYTIGIGYDASEKFMASMEVQKEEDQSVNVNAGLQYRFVKQLMARVGISSTTASGWIGVGLMLNTFRIDVSASYHPQLGLTPGLLFIYHFEKKAK